MRKTHQTIKKVTADIEKDYHFNTAIAALMELVNETASLLATSASGNPETSKEWDEMEFAVKNTLLMIAPFAPHISEELWEALGEKNSIFECQWPVWDEALAKEDEVELVVQINGKLRAKLLVPSGLSDDDARKRALEDQKIREALAGKEPGKVVVVKGRLVNIVIK